MVQIKGIDVSWHNGVIDWPKVKADGVQFVFIKATEGTNYNRVDYFKSNVPKALAAGLHVGAYHFARFTNVPEAICEAKYFVSVVKDFKLDYPLVLDLEVNDDKVGKKQLTDAAIAFLEYLENAGYFAMLYTGDCFLDDQLEKDRLKPYAQWLAHYCGSLRNNADIWQNSENGRVNGISGDVDMNISYRDFAAEITAMNKFKVVAAINSAIPAYIGTIKVNIESGHLNIRDKPDMSGNVIGELKVGDPTEYKVYDKRFGWYKLSLEGAIPGWVSEKYVTFKPV